MEKDRLMVLIRENKLSGQFLQKKKKQKLGKYFRKCEDEERQIKTHDNNNYNNIILLNNYYLPVTLQIYYYFNFNVNFFYLFFSFKQNFNSLSHLSYVIIR